MNLINKKLKNVCAKMSYGVVKSNKSVKIIRGKRNSFFEPND